MRIPIRLEYETVCEACDPVKKVAIPTIGSKFYHGRCAYSITSLCRWLCGEISGAVHGAYVQQKQNTQKSKFRINDLISLHKQLKQTLATINNPNFEFFFTDD